jgi:hypothetical protein
VLKWLTRERQMMPVLLLRCLQRTDKVQLLLLLRCSSCCSIVWWLAVLQASVSHGSEDADLPADWPHALTQIACWCRCNEALLQVGCLRISSSCSTAGSRLNAVPADLCCATATPQAAGVASRAMHSVLLLLLLLHLWLLLPLMLMLLLLLLVFVCILPYYTGTC